MYALAYSGPGASDDLALTTQTHSYDEVPTVAMDRYKPPSSVPAISVYATEINTLPAGVPDEYARTCQGAWASAQTGATIGTFVGGPVGTAVGGVVGGAVGAIGGSWMGNKISSWF